jgi:hypothetical protein
MHFSMTMRGFGAAFFLGIGFAWIKHMSDRGTLPTRHGLERGRAKGINRRISYHPIDYVALVRD